MRYALRTHACAIFDCVSIVVLFFLYLLLVFFFFFSSRRRHTRFDCDWSSDVCSSDLVVLPEEVLQAGSEQAHARRAARQLGGAPRYEGNGRERTGHVAEAALARPPRSEERRVGKEGRSRWSPYH